MYYYLAQISYVGYGTNAQNYIWKVLADKKFAYVPGYDNQDRKYCTVFLKSWAPEYCLKQLSYALFEEKQIKVLDLYAVSPEMHPWNTPCTLEQYMRGL